MSLEKQNRLILTEIKCISVDEITEGMQVDELLQLASGKEGVYFTPGSAVFGIEKKENNTGVFFEKEISYTVPGILKSSDIYSLMEVSALVVKTEEGREFCFYENDYFANSPLRFSMSSTSDKTKISFSILSLTLD